MYNYYRARSDIFLVCHVKTNVQKIGRLDDYLHGHLIATRRLNMSNRSNCLGSSLRRSDKRLNLDHRLIDLVKASKFCPIRSTHRLPHASLHSINVGRFARSWFSADADAIDHRCRRCDWPPPSHCSARAGAPRTSPRRHPQFPTVGV
jgi:hypothetical protein